jgi:hypothetical protein
VHSEERAISLSLKLLLLLRQPRFARNLFSGQDNQSDPCISSITRSIMITSSNSPLREQLLEGCWRAFEGQYFDIWEPGRAGKPMVVARQLIHDDWCWTFWTGTDYGFSGSVAFSVLLCRSPEGGPIYVLDEFPHDLTEARKIDVKRFARVHYRALIRMPMRYEQPQRTAAMYLGPDCWSERGDTHTLADLANEELEPYDLSFQPARNDRAGGAQLVYTMLQTGELVIADTW